MIQCVATSMGEKSSELSATTVWKKGLFCFLYFNTQNSMVFKKCNVETIFAALQGCKVSNHL